MEIQELGGRCFLVAAPNLNPIRFFKDMKLFYSSYFEEYFAVHIHDIFMPFFLMRCKKGIGAQKIIMHAHVTVFGYSKMKAVRNYLLSLPKYIIADEYWACSKDAGEALFGKRFNTMGRVLNNAISIEKFVYNQRTRKKVRNELKVEDCFVIGHVGWFNPQKNHAQIIEIFKKLAVQKDSARLVLVGDGEYRDRIAQECKRASIADKVLFLGVRDDVNRIMNSFDVFLFPSKYEGLGIALVEAQSLGIPCVFSNTIPIEVNILERQNKVLSLDDPVDMWVDAIVHAQRRYEDPHKYLRMAGFDIKTEAKRIVDYYKQGIN